jgi:hypothetical protein
MMRFRSLRAALAVAFPLLALSVATGEASADDATPPAPAAPQPSQRGHVHGVARPQVAFQGMTLAIQLESPLDSLIGFED